MPEHTIAEDLTRLTAARTDIADAITAKGGTVNQGDGLEEFPADIASIPAGGGGASIGDVNFYDYDGTIVDSYTASEFASLTAMPNNPSHEGLTAQGWNWSLVNAKAYVAKYGKLNVGQMYNTDDGALRIYIRLEEGRLSPVLGLCPEGTLTIDWGDGSPTGVMTGSSTYSLHYLSHTYATAGDYVISALPSAGSKIGFGYTNSTSAILCKSSNDKAIDRYVYLNAVYKIEIPDSVTTIYNNAFAYCTGLSSITLPHSIASISSYAFEYCYNLPSIIIPDSVTHIYGSAFYTCYALTSVIIPDSVTFIGDGTFRSCSSLASVTLPNSITSIGNVFQTCTSLSSVIIPDSFTSIGGTAFNQCYSLLSVIIPNSVTSIGGNAFKECSSLSSVIISDSVTTIGGSSFSSCYRLSSVTIPDSVTSIGSSAFNSCYGLGFIKFTSTTPPTVAGSNAWTGIPTDCIIYVPTGYLETYKGAANYPSPSTYQYVEY